MAPCKDEYLLFADHVVKTGGDLRIVPMYDFLTRHSAEKILLQLDAAGLTQRHGSANRRYLADGITPEQAATWARIQALDARPCKVRVAREEEPEYDPRSSVMIAADTSDVFRPGRWFARTDFTQTLLDACWEPGLIVRLWWHDASRCFEVVGDIAPDEIPEDETPTPQELVEMEFVTGKKKTAKSDDDQEDKTPPEMLYHWRRVDNGLRLRGRPGRRPVLKEVIA